jgi:hypothetical protein
VTYAVVADAGGLQKGGDGVPVLVGRGRDGQGATETREALQEGAKVDLERWIEFADARELDQAAVSDLILNKLFIYLEYLCTCLTFSKMIVNLSLLIHKYIF